MNNGVKGGLIENYDTVLLQLYFRYNVSYEYEYALGVL